MSISTPSIAPGTRPKSAATATPARPGAIPFGGYALAYLTIIFVMCLIQLVLGADPLIVTMAGVAAGLSVLPAVHYGWRDMPALITLLVGARYATSAIAWKTFDLDPLDHGLHAAEESFLVVLIGVTATTLAAFAAHIFWPRKPLFRENYSQLSLILLCAIGLLLILARVFSRSFQVPILGGIWALFGFGFTILPVAWLALNMKLRRPLFTLDFIAGMIFIFAFSLAMNARFASGILLLAIAAFAICFHIRIRPVYIVSGLVVALFFTNVLAPAMTDIRRYRASAGPTELISLTFDRMIQRLSGEVVDTTGFDTRNNSFASNYQYVPSNTFLERAVNVQQLDLAVALAAYEGTLGLERFKDALIALLPSGLTDDKSALQSDFIFWKVGAIEVGSTYAIEITSFGSAYVYGGKTFVFAVIFVGFALIFIAFRVFCPRFENSLLAPTLLLAQFQTLTAGSAESLFGTVTREMPLIILLFWGFSILGNTRSAR